MRRLWVAAPAVISTVAAIPTLTTRKDPSPDVFRRRGLHAITVLGDYLYIEGGELSTYLNGVQQGDQESLPLTQTLSIPLTESWDNTSVKINQVSNHTPIPINSASLWSNPNNSTMYRWGGDGTHGDLTAGKDINLWKFSADGKGGGSWSIQEPSNKDTFDKLISASNGGASVCNGVGYFLGGYATAASDSRILNPFTSNLPIPGLLTFNMKSSAWSNESTVALSPPYGTTLRSETACTSGFEQDSSNGLLVALGGDSSSPAAATVDTSQFNSFGNISFYDPNSNQWHSQTATGDIPTGREHFCAVGAAAKDGAYNIYIFGGQNFVDGTSNEMYVLSLPAFNWFRVEGLDATPRLQHQCAKAGTKQMIIVGGLTAEFTWEIEDEWANGIAVMDMVDLKWKSRYDVDEDEYESPEMIKDFYRKGGYEKVSWSNNAVEKYFGKVSLDMGPPPAATTTAAASDDSSPSHATPVGAIAGGTVGGVAFLGGITLLSICYRRRRRRRDEEPETMDDKFQSESSASTRAPSSRRHRFGPAAERLSGALGSLRHPKRPRPARPPHARLKSELDGRQRERPAELSSKDGRDIAAWKLERKWKLRDRNAADQASVKSKRVYEMQG